MAENHEPGKWDAVVCSGFAAVNVLSSTNVEELGWAHIEPVFLTRWLDLVKPCGLQDGLRVGAGPVEPSYAQDYREQVPHKDPIVQRLDDGAELRIEVG
ncbi:MAG: hypothetical protein U0O20_02455 [Collinsella aerofaciens]